jgi:hypothetical protein
MGKVIEAIVARAGNQKVYIPADLIESVKDLQDGTVLITTASGYQTTVENVSNSFLDEWYAAIGVSGAVEDVKPVGNPVAAVPK